MAADIKTIRLHKDDAVFSENVHLHKLPLPALADFERSVFDQVAAIERGAPMSSDALERFYRDANQYEAATGDNLLHLLSGEKQVAILLIAADRGLLSVREQAGILSVLHTLPEEERLVFEAADKRLEKAAQAVKAADDLIAESPSLIGERERIENIFFHLPADFIKPAKIAKRLKHGGAEGAHLETLAKLSAEGCKLEPVWREPTPTMRAAIAAAKEELDKGTISAGQVHSWIGYEIRLVAGVLEFGRSPREEVETWAATFDIDHNLNPGKIRCQILEVVGQFGKRGQEFVATLAKLKSLNVEGVERLLERAAEAAHSKRPQLEAAGLFTEAVAVSVLSANPLPATRLAVSVEELDGHRLRSQGFVGKQVPREFDVVLLSNDGKPLVIFEVKSSVAAFEKKNRISGQLTDRQFARVVRDTQLYALSQLAALLGPDVRVCHLIDDSPEQVRNIAEPIAARVREVLRGSVGEANLPVVLSLAELSGRQRAAKAA